MTILPPKSIVLISNGELPKSNASGAWPLTSPMQIAPRSLCRSASASSTVATMMIREAPFASATAAVVNARKVSMTATVPVAPLAPSNRLRSEILIAFLGNGLACSKTSQRPVRVPH